MTATLLLLVLFTLAPLSLQGPDRNVIRVGGLYVPNYEELMVAFRAAVDHVNADKSVLPKHQMMAVTEKVSLKDSLSTCAKVCELMQTGVSGVFGPQSEDTAEHVQSVCDTMEVPHVEMRWDLAQRRGACAVNLFPHPSVLASAIRDLVETWEWKSFTIIYETDDGLIRLNELLKLYDPKGHTVTVRQLEPGDNNRPLLKRIKNSNEINIVLDCTIEKLPEILMQAQQVGLMAGYYSYIITNLDMHTLDLEPYQYGGTNITGIRVVDPSDPDVRTAVQEMNDLSRNFSFAPETLRMETALMYDSVRLFAKALHWLVHSQRVSFRPLNCETVENWEHGFSLVNFMKSTEIKGTTGVTRFDNEGFRSHLVLDIVELNYDGLVSIGSWNSTDGVNLTRVHKAAIQEGSESLQNKTFVVMTALSDPYGMLKETSLKLNGNDRFEGFGTELIQEISMMLGFNYTFKLQDDGVYGSINKQTGQWNGMLREIIDGRADLAITDLTITYDRESAVDFTMPFMNLGISILYRKPTKQPPSLFSFMSPFSNEVWVYMFSAYIGVSVLLFALARCSPYEWTNPYPCIEEPDHLENLFSLKNSLWFTIGSLMQQGSDIAPTAVSTRMVAGIWWFFTLIMVSSYTANLAAFLTIESMSSPIKSVEDLANQNVIKYGAKRDGSTASFFRDSNYSTYQRMWQFMKDNPDVFTSTNQEGIQRVKSSNGKYAFFMESSSIEYVVERECELAQVGGLLDAKGYGIAMRKNSPYRNAISAAVLKLQEVGKMYALKVKWWKEKRGGGQCKDDSAGSGAASELGLANVGGVFVVLIAGCVMAIFIALLELCWHVGQLSRDKRIQFWPEIGSEIKFALKCKGSTKPVKKLENEEDTTVEEDVMDGFTPLSQYALPIKSKSKSSINA
ncbi:glutamate receptor ionotropic, kainate 2-like [Cloeon dipterum]|uniref:glutamate receptor ionotropic, kainate 2-like n=1 Tax=Cloeon dipterum TaxID=197152 RepID=UPI00321F784A